MGGFVSKKKKKEGDKAENKSKSHSVKRQTVESATQTNEADAQSQKYDDRIEQIDEMSHRDGNRLRKGSELSTTPSAIPEAESDSSKNPYILHPEVFDQFSVVFKEAFLAHHINSISYKHVKVDVIDINFEQANKTISMRWLEPFIQSLRKRDESCKYISARQKDLKSMQVNCISPFM
jgi:predicted nucleotidyltransferase component of viral defense system